MKFLRYILFFVMQVPVMRSQVYYDFTKYAECDKRVNFVKDSTDVIGFVEYVRKNIPDEEMKCRAIYKWITSTIEYDINAMYTLNLKANKKDMVGSALKDKKAICMGYSFLFDSLCQLTGLSSQVICGSVKMQWFPEPCGHAWNAVKINNTWSLVDATWGSGYIENKRFIRKLNNKFFLVSGGDLTMSHHPIDPIWQLSEKPKTLQEFYNSSLAYGLESEKWAYEDSVETYLKSPEIDKLKSTQRRLKQNGTNSSVTNDYYIYLENRIAGCYYRIGADGVEFMNQGVDLFNDYINYKNRQFVPVKTDNEVEKILPEIENKLLTSKQLFEKAISFGNEDLSRQAERNLRNNNEMLNRLPEEKTFVAQYLKTPKAKRKGLFYKKVYGK